MQTNYERWQIERYGNVLPESVSHSEVFENNADQEGPMIPDVSGEAPAESKFDNQ